MKRFENYLPALLSLVLAAAGSAYGAAGSLDPTFGKGGQVVTTFVTRSAPFQDAIPAAAALQSDGKIVIAMGFQNSVIASEGFGVVRCLTNGALDKTFGSNGSVQTAFTNFINSPYSLAIQSDGKIVVAGNATSADGTLSEFAVARFTTSGALDTTFGTGGQVTTNFVGVMTGGVSNPANAVLIQPDGKILAGGGASQCAKCVHNTALARYNINGTLDTTFGNGGMVSIAGIGPVTKLALDAAGDIFALNTTAIAEFSPAGVLDSTITPAPITVSSHGFFAPSAFQPDGRYLVAESVSGISRHDIETQVVRFAQTGQVDSTFNNPPFDYSAEGSATNDTSATVALQPNGQIVTGGIHFAGGFDLFGLARLNSNGSLDVTFGTGGVLTTSFQGQTSAQVTSVLIQPDGKIIAVGQTLTSNGIANLALARYLGQ